MAPKFVFNATGTRGDLIPVLAIAAELQRRGHEVHVLANDPEGAVARGFDVPFTSVAPAQVNNLKGIEDAFGRHVFASYGPTFDFIESELARGTEVALVSMECHTAATLMAERHGLPLCRLALTPFRIFSLEQHCYPLRERLAGPLARTYRRYVIPRMNRRDYEHPYVISGINGFRQQLGLAPISSVCELEQRASYQLCLFPEWYCPEAGGAERRQFVGFPLPRSQGALPAELSAFIDRHGDPIVFTPGTGVVDVSAFFAAAQQCCTELGRAGVFLSPSLPAEQRGASGSIYRLDYIDLALVLPRTALLVHHGGMGTTARALEAGVPQIISPQAFDQPDNGDRVSRLGVGSMIRRRDLSGAALATAAGALLGNVDVRRTLRDLSQRIGATSAAVAAAAALERDFLTGPSRSSRHDLGASDDRQLEHLGL